MIRFEPLDAAITYAAAHPDEFAMQSWFRQTDCGTTACLAGTLALQAGWTPANWTTERATGEASDGRRAARVMKDGRFSGVSAVATEILGLNEFSDLTLILNLFFAPNLAAVIRIRNGLARQAGVPERDWAVAK